MHILLVNNTRIPVAKYGGTERVIWWLGRELVSRGHKVTYLVAPGSVCSFARVLPYQASRSLAEQIPGDVDMVHVHFPIRENLEKPYMVTIHGNGKPGEVFDVNTVFVSKDHAHRHNSKHYVYNGLGLDEYGKVDFTKDRKHWIFLAKGSRPEKNKKGAIRIALKMKERLVIAGSRGFSLHPLIRYTGFVGGARKNQLLNQSRGLLFPIRWHEPFGLSILESLYFGAPVFGTAYGSLPELLPESCGLLSNRSDVILEGMKHVGDFNRRHCHEYVADNFHAGIMAEAYLAYYEKAMKGQPINTRKPFAEERKKPELLPFY